MAGQILFDLAVARNRLGNACRRIPIPVVPGPMSNQNAPRLFDRPDQIHSLHATTNSRTLRMPGISPLVRSL